MMKWIRKILWKLLQVAMVAVLVLAALVAIAILPDVPGMRRFSRYRAYPNKDALLVAESNDVRRCDSCAINGTNVTVVVMEPCRWLASGCAMLVYDANGALIDKTSDEGDDSRFQQKWIRPWSEALTEKTRRWLRETRLPEAPCDLPNTMTDFAAYMEQASKDFDDLGKPNGKRGIRFRCCKTAAKVVFPEKLKNELPFVDDGSAGGISIWDALTNACERTGCTYRIYDHAVDICNCK